MSAPLLRFEAVSKSFGGTQAVDAVTLAVPDGGEGLSTLRAAHCKPSR